MQGSQNQLVYVSYLLPAAGDAIRVGKKPPSESRILTGKVIATVIQKRYGPGRFDARIVFPHQPEHASFAYAIKMGKHYTER
jgi:hypothetical protein